MVFHILKWCNENIVYLLVFLFITFILSFYISFILYTIPNPPASKMYIIQKLFNHIISFFILSFNIVILIVKYDHLFEILIYFLNDYILLKNN